MALDLVFVVIDVVLVSVFVTKVTRAIGRKVRTLIQRHRNRRWVRALPLARPACPSIGRAESASSQAPGAAARTAVASGVLNRERWRVQL